MNTTTKTLAIILAACGLIAAQPILVPNSSLLLAKEKVSAKPTDEDGKGPLYHPKTGVQLRGATYEEIRKHQALGRVVVAPDGSLFV